MKTALYYNNRDTRIEEQPVPEPGEGEILVKTKACGVCVADTMEWYLVHRAPLVLGHEPTGVVAKTGNGVTGFKEGDRVFVHHHVPCLTCEYCRNGFYTMCSTFRQTNIKPGGFSDYFIASADHVKLDTLLLPGDVSYQAGTLIEPLACVVHAIRNAEVKPFDSVALIGTGAIGLMFIQALKFIGVRKLVVYELIPWRQEKAKEFGAPVVVTPFEDQEAEMERIEGILDSQGADKVFVAAKDIRAMELGMQLANKGGTILLFATPEPEETTKFYPSKIFFREQRVMSSYSANHLDTRFALDLIANQCIDTDALITNTYPLERLSEAILATAGRGNHLKSIITF